MGHDLGLFVGVTTYDIAETIRYAERDAIRIKECFEKVNPEGKSFLVTDTSPPIGKSVTVPTRATLRRMLLELESLRGVSSENNIWFFFSGHGLRRNEKDYLLPKDANPDDLDQTAIAVEFVIAQLSMTKAGNIVLFLDACRDSLKGAKGPDQIGHDSESVAAKERGIISLYSCSPTEASWEAEQLESGTFTYALFEALTIRHCATIRQINEYLLGRVPALNSEYKKPTQRPRLVVDPDERGDLILIPAHAQPTDIQLLRSLAQNLEARASPPTDRADLQQALDIWKRINAAAKGGYPDFYEVFTRISNKLNLATISQSVRVNETEPSRNNLPTTTNAIDASAQDEAYIPTRIKYVPGWARLAVFVLLVVSALVAVISGILSPLAGHNEFLMVTSIAAGVTLLLFVVAVMQTLTVRLGQRSRESARDILQRRYQAQITPISTYDHNLAIRIARPAGKADVIFSLLGAASPFYRLSMNCTYVRDYSRLDEALPYLEEVNLEKCYNLRSLDFLSAYTQLHCVRLTGCKRLSDIYALGTLFGLTELTLNMSQSIDHFSVLGQLSNLVTLELSDHLDLVDVDFLANCTRLSKVDLHGCTNLRSVVALQKLSDLKELNIVGCPSVLGTETWDAHKTVIIR